MDVYKVDVCKADDTNLMAESKEELKSLLMKVKEESEKLWLKTQHSKNEDHGIQSHHFMVNDGETMETVRDFILGSSKITARAPHSSTLAWKIPWMEEPGGLQSMGLLRVGMTERLHFQFPALEEEMATHSSVLAWRIPGTGEPGGLPSMGSHRVRHD